MIKDVSKIAPGAINKNVKDIEAAKEAKEEKAHNEALDRGEPTQLAHSDTCSIDWKRCLFAKKFLRFWDCSEKGRDEKR